MKRRLSAGTLMRFVVIALILLFLLFPIYWMFATSFKTNMEAYRFPPTFFPEAPTVQSYVNLVEQNNQFFVYYGNNFLISSLTALTTGLCAVLAGYGLSRFRFRIGTAFVALLTFCQMFPVISRMISLYSLLGRVHLINTRSGLILALTAAMIPFSVMLMTSFFKGVPHEIEEAALVDGAGRIGILFRIVLPLVAGGIVAVCIYTFLMTWDDYLHALTLIQTDNLRTLSVGIALRYLGELSYDWSLVNTISVVGTLPMVLVFFFFQRYMVKGLVAGAVKG